MIQLRCDISTSAVTVFYLLWHCFWVVTLLSFWQDDTAKMYGHVNDQGSAKLQVIYLVSARKVFIISK